MTGRVGGCDQVVTRDIKKQRIQQETYEQRARVELKGQRLIPQNHTIMSDSETTRHSKAIDKTKWHQLVPCSIQNIPTLKINDSQMSAQGIEEGQTCSTPTQPPGEIRLMQYLHIFTECSDKLK